MLKNVLLPRRKFPSLKQIIAGNIKCEELCVRDIRQVKTNFGRETTSGVFNKLNICGRHILEPRIWSGPAEECGRKEKKMFANLVVELKKHHYSQRGLAAYIGISESSMNDKMNGRTQFTLREAKAIQAVFEGRTLDYLFEEKE